MSENWASKLIEVENCKLVWINFEDTVQKYGLML